MKMNDSDLMALMKEVDPNTVRIPSGVRKIVDAITASKQREIEALHQQVLELSAQVEVMREALDGSNPPHRQRKH